MRRVRTYKKRTVGCVFSKGSDVQLQRFCSIQKKIIYFKGDMFQNAMKGNDEEEVQSFVCCYSHVDKLKLKVDV
ncbi:hypothetical protein [Sutcliffiella halmapala]|uniref:hypothetical protein n=1 Tax=Sutcliffiella halmapala TaxID=79882 RepID=UPI001116FAF1|nr:hypothetical protein [Sutcliffiella halmapala]